MAAKKKAKAKRKAAKKKSRKKVARKKVTRRAAKKKVAAEKRTKAKAKKRKPVAKVARTAAAAPKPATAVAPPAERIGIVTHYFTHLMVAIVQLESGSLREGDTVHIKGHTSDFSQRVDSMELDHVHVGEAYAGQSVGLRVREHTREHDVVYKVM